jgi:hypothetical protein
MLAMIYLFNMEILKAQPSMIVRAITMDSLIHIVVDNKTCWEVQLNFYQNNTMFTLHSDKEGYVKKYFVVMSYT